MNCFGSGLVRRSLRNPNDVNAVIRSASAILARTRTHRNPAHVYALTREISRRVLGTIGAKLGSGLALGIGETNDDDRSLWLVLQPQSYVIQNPLADVIHT